MSAEEQKRAELKLLFFTYAIYVFSLIWFINNKLITKVDSIDFKN